MSINLDKGDVVSLSQMSEDENEKLERIRLGVGWFPKGYIPERFRESKSTDIIKTEIQTTEPSKKKGILHKIGEMLKGEARAGDVINTTIDRIKDAVSDDSILVDPNSPSYMEQITQLLEEVDVDTSAMFFSKGKLIAMVWFPEHHQRAFNNAVIHGGDNKTGLPDAGKSMEDDKEYIYIDITKLPSDIDEIIEFVNIYRANERGQSFGQFGGGFARLTNDDNDRELAFFNLSGKEYDGYEAIILLRMYIHNDGWKIETVGKGLEKGSHPEDIRDLYLKMKRRGEI